MAGAPNDLGSQSIGKLLMKYSVPAIIASVATSLYNIIDSIFIGQGVGPMAIAGLAITFPLMNLVIGFCTLIAVGGAAITSIFLGQKNLMRTTEVLNTVTGLCIVHALVFGSLTYIFLDEILFVFGATPETIPYAREFMTVILWGTPISYLFIGLNNIMRASGYPKKAMYSALFSVATNVVLAPIFIFKFDWGIGGAALATIIGQAVALVWVLCHFFSKTTYVHFDFKIGGFSKILIERIYAIGLSPFLMNCCACLVVVFLNKALLDYGAADGNMAVGAYGILNRTTMFFVMIVFGVTQGMQPILGYNFGAGNWPRVKRTLYTGIWIGFAITSLGWALTEIFPDAISRMFTDDPTIVNIARSGFRIYFILYPVVGVQIVIQNYFQSIGKPKLSIFLSLTRQLLLLLPLLWLLPRFWGISGVWSSMAGSDFLSFLLAIIVMYITTRKYNKNYAAQHPGQGNA